MLAKSYKICLMIFLNLLLINIGSYAQGNSLRFKGKVKIENGNATYKDVQMTLFKDGQVEQVLEGKKKFDFDLEYNHMFALVVELEGYYTKYIEIDGVVDAIAFEEDIRPYVTHVHLFEERQYVKNDLRLNKKMEVYYMGDFTHEVTERYPDYGHLIMHDEFEESEDNNSEDQEIETSDESGLDLVTAVEIEVFPNPNNGAFSLSALKKIRQIQLFNLHGQLIHTQAINSMNASIELPSSFEKGVYVLKADFEGESANKRIIID